MSFKVDQINMSNGDTLVITHTGSKELALFIFINGDGKMMIDGPANKTARRFVIETSGIKEIRKPRKPVRRKDPRF
jgi:hypothetical protein